jgi:hypothetical protein
LKLQVSLENATLTLPESLISPGSNRAKVVFETSHSDSEA